MPAVVDQIQFEKLVSFQHLRLGATEYALPYRASRHQRGDVGSIDLLFQKEICREAV